MRKTRYYARLITAFSLRFKGLIIISSIIGVLLFASSYLAGTFLFKNTTEYIGITGRYNPDNLPSNILEMISGGLTIVNEEKRIDANIAESWETDDNGKTWKFKLSTNYTWQDGTPVTSKDINYDYSDVEIERPDDQTIIFKLKEGFSPFPSVISKPVFKKGLLGIGSWEVDNITLAGNNVSEITLVNNDGNKKIFKFYPTEQRTKLAYKLGAVDQIIDLYEPSPFDDWKTSEVSNNNNLNKIVTIFLNTEDNFLSNKSLRQALAYAINKQSFNETRSISPIARKSWAYNSQVKSYDYDLDRAKEAISEVEQEQGQISIKLVSTPILLSVAEEIKTFWQDVGVDTTIQVSSITPQEFQAYLAIFDIPNDPDQYSVWHSTQTNSNISKYSSPRIDKLLEDGRTVVNQEDRKKIYLDFQRFLLEDLPAIFLYNPTTYNISRK